MSRDDDIIRIAEEVARARWASRTAQAHRRAALLLRLARSASFFGEAAIAIASVARLVGADEDEGVPLAIGMSLISSALAPAVTALRLTPEQTRRLVDICARAGERRAQDYYRRLHDLMAAAQALAASAAEE